MRSSTANPSRLGGFTSTALSLWGQFFFIICIYSLRDELTFGHCLPAPGSLLQYNITQPSIQMSSLRPEQDPLQQRRQLKPGSHCAKLKKDVVSVERLHVSPSPVKRPSPLKGGRQLSPCLPEALRDEHISHLNSNKIMIRQFELVEFTKKFALEKADLEDRIEALYKQNQGLKSRLVRADDELRRATHLFNSRESLENQELSRLQKMVNDLLGHKGRAEGEIAALRGELGRLSSQASRTRAQIDQLTRLLAAERTKAFELDRIKLSMIDSNNKLSDENQLLVQNIKALDEAKEDLRKSLQATNAKLSDSAEQLRAVRNLNSMVEEQYRVRTNELENACMRLVMVSCAANLMDGRVWGEPRKQLGDSRLEITVLEIENQHLKKQLELEREKQGSSQHNMHEENQKLSAECKQLNRRIFDLTMQVGRNDPSASIIQPSSFCSDMLSYPQCQNCQSMQNQVEQLLSKLCCLEEELQGIQQSPSSLQMELMRSELAEHLKLKSDFGKLGAKIKLMEEVIVTLKGENDELKKGRGSDRMGKSSIFKKDLKGIVFAYERDRLTSAQKQNLLQQEIKNMKAHLDEYHSETTVGSTDRQGTLGRVLELSQEVTSGVERAVQTRTTVSPESVEAMLGCLEECLRFL